MHRRGKACPRIEINTLDSRRVGGDLSSTYCSALPLPPLNFRWLTRAFGFEGGDAQAQMLQAEELELARQAGFSKANVNLLFRYGSDLRRLEDVDGRPVAGVSVMVPDGSAMDAVRALRIAFGGTHVVFQSEQNFGHAPDRVALLRSSDPYDALRTMSTNGANHGIGTDSIIARLREWDRRYGVTLIGAGDDWVEMELGRAPSDWVALAREVYEFCPDVVDQGAETVEALAAEMKQKRIIFLWWN